MPRQLNSYEEDMLRYLGAVPTINSGAIFGDADGIIPTKFGLTGYNYGGITVEVKSTEKKSFSVTTDIFSKMIKEAERYLRMPLLAVNFGKTTKVVILRADDFVALLEQIRNQEEELNKQNEMIRSRQIERNFVD